MDGIFVGKHLWLDFANTELAEGNDDADQLSSIASLRAWMAGVSGMSDDVRPGRTADQRVLNEAIALRRAVRTIAEHAVAGADVPEEPVARINRILRTCVTYPQLAPAGDAFELTYPPVGDSPLRCLGPIALSAAQFLERYDRTLVKQCQHPNCVLFYYDTTKDRTRRFCSAETCGSRTRAATSARRRKASGGTAADA